MDVVVAVEGVRVLCLVVDAFNLDCGMVQFELSAAPVSHGSQRLQRLVRLNVHGHRHFALGNGPNVQVVHVNDVAATSLVNCRSQLFNLELAGSTFHQDFDARLNDRNRGYNDNDREKVGADGVSPPKVWVKVDAAGCNDDSNAHEHVTKHVQVSGLNVQILLSNFVFGFRVIVYMAVIVFVVMSVVVLMVVSMVMFMIMGVVVARMVMSMVMSSMIVIVVVTGVVVVMIVCAVAMVMVAALATQVVMSSLARVQNLNLDQVEDKGEHSDNQHLVADNLDWCKEAHSSFSKKPNRHNPDSCDRDQCSNNFSAVPSICQVIAHTSLSQPERDNRDGEPNDI